MRQSRRCDYRLRVGQAKSATTGPVQARHSQSGWGNLFEWHHTDPPELQTAPLGRLTTTG